jgi:Ulp1 family protease
MLQWMNLSSSGSIQQGPKQSNRYDCGVLVSLAARHQCNLSGALYRELIASELTAFRQEQLGNFLLGNDGNPIELF